MKALVIGSGAREHALVWKLAKGARVRRIFTAPGNPGTAALSENVPIKADDMGGLKRFALEEKIDLTIVGPEAPLVNGIVDEFRAAGLGIFGPTRSAARIEGSKVFSKDLMKRYNIPTAGFMRFDDPREARGYAGSGKYPLVIKADGLAGGKGVIIARSRDEALDAIGLIMEQKAFGQAGKSIVIEEFLEGEEASFLVITDGRSILPLSPAQDHKTVFDKDKGPNTGGMGAYCPAPIVTRKLEQEILSTIIEPTIKAMENEGSPYSGVLYAGIMITKDGPKVLEFNCRFGDPETEAILPLLEDDLFEVLFDAAEARLSDRRLNWREGSSVCVVMSAKGYPGEYEKGDEIHGLEHAGRVEDAVVFHAGTSMDGGRLVTSGGRVLAVTAVGPDMKSARDRAYEAVGRIGFEGAHYRRDIGWRAC